MLHVSGNDVPLDLQVPSTSCCNCGTSSGVSPRKTALKHTRYFGLAGTELTFTLELPYCRACVATGARFRQGIFSKVLVVALLFFPLLLAGVFVVPDDFPRHLLPWAALAGAGVLAAGYYVLRRPRGSQTSFYQPVSLAGVEQTFGGKVTRIRLRCSNQSFARALSSANLALVEARSLEVVSD
jgi:hypothetical protein